MVDEFACNGDDNADLLVLDAMTWALTYSTRMMKQDIIMTLFLGVVCRRMKVIDGWMIRANSVMMFDIPK